MPFGFIDTTYIDFPATVDNTYLRGLTLRSGMQFTEAAGIIDAGLRRLNAGVDPQLAMLLAPPTTEVFAMGGRTARMVPTKRSEYTLARPQYVERQAHMLAIDEAEIALGWTEDGLNDMTRDSLAANVEAMVAGFEAMARAETLSRLFNDAEIPVVASGTATTTTSPGFAGSGTGGNVFSGVYPDNTALPGGYTHYYRDTTANLGTLIQSMRDRLKKWHAPPFDLIGSQSIVSQVMALGAAAFVPVGSPLVRLGDTSNEALLDASRYVGVLYGDIRVQVAIPDFTTDNFAIFKSYGDLNPRNPLVWRFDPQRGRDVIVRSRSLFPLAEANGIWKWGANVNERTGAALATVAASGVYVAPTFTY